MTKYVLNLSKKAPTDWPSAWRFPPVHGVMPPGWPRRMSSRSAIDAKYSGSVLAVIILDGREEDTDEFDGEILQVTARDQHGQMVRLRSDDDASGESHIWYEMILIPIQLISGIVHGAIRQVIVDDPTGTACLDVQFFGIEDGPRVVLDIHGTDLCCS